MPPIAADSSDINGWTIITLRKTRAGWAESPVEFSHFRTRDQREVDLVVESSEGEVIGVEVKAKSSIEEADFRGLRLPRDRLRTGLRAVGGHCFDTRPASNRTSTSSPSLSAPNNAE
ncbi:DUF4143 domain-containing protein [Nonomuraea basaltis]|uniref:DUF4143 domain-containing protein n=1 Tax=Nonomuraea basaltis TaxID=2495887 RepID=UPI003B84B64B